MKQNSSVRDVENILNQLNIYYEREKTFNDLKYKGKLRFDYYLPKYNLCIEFNGAQHYEYIEYFHKDDSQFDEQRIKDYIKHEYCRAHSIHLIELPCSLTNDEIRAELVQFINNIGDETSQLLPRIDEFLDLNESQDVYINLLYEEYKKMLKQINETNKLNYQCFKEYVINYWDLINSQLIKDRSGNYYEYFINEDINREEILNDADTVLQHYYELEDLGVFTYSHIPSCVLYEHYKYWLKLVNPSAKLMKQSEYTKRLSLVLKDICYSQNEKKRLRQLTKDQFDINMFENLYIDDSLQSKIFINPDLDIESRVEEIEDDIIELDKDQIKDKYDESLIRSYLNYVKDKNPADYLILIAPYQTNEINDLNIDTIIEKLIDYYQE